MLLPNKLYCSSSMVLQGLAKQTPSTQQHPSLKDVAVLQDCAEPNEKALWSRKGCLQSESGLWLHPDGVRPVCPNPLLHMLARAAHGPAHVGKGGITSMIRTQWFCPWNHSRSRVKTCLIFLWYSMPSDHAQTEQQVSARPCHHTELL